MTTTIPTVIGQAYTLTYAYRGPGLVDWWPFEGDATDLIGTNDGVITPTLTNVTGMVGQGFQFDGNNSQINFGTNAGNFGTNDFTIDYWMNTSSNSTSNAFLNKRAACIETGAGYIPMWDIRIGSGFLAMELFSADGTADFSVVSSTPINDGLWHHVAWVRRGRDVYLYQDAVLKAHNNDGVVHSVSNNAPLILGTDVCQCCDGTLPYSGAADELDFWNRALTDVEIAAIYQAGTNHIGKATPASILPNANLLVNGLTNTTLVAPASSPAWLTNAVYFTAVNSNTTLALQGHPLGLLFDDFLLQTPANLNYVQPEEPLAPFNGQDPYGCWTLDVWDTRSDSATPTNGVLLSWNLQMTVSSTNISLIVLTNHIPYTNGLVAANAIV